MLPARDGVLEELIGGGVFDLPRDSEFVRFLVQVVGVLILSRLLAVFLTELFSSMLKRGLPSVFEKVGEGVMSTVAT